MKEYAHCKHCGKQFEVKPRRKQFCNRSCNIKAMHVKRISKQNVVQTGSLHLANPRDWILAET